MEDPQLAELFAQDVVLMRLVGMNPVVVHGGGPQISDLMRRLGKEPEFVDGLRVTDAETVDIVRMALVGKVNREVVASVNRHGSYAVGLSGEDAGLITVDARDEKLGFVGDVQPHRPVDPRAPHPRGADPCRRHRRRRRRRSGVQRERRHRRRCDRGGACAPRSSCTSPTSPACTRDFADESSLSHASTSTELAALADGGALSEGMIPKVRSCVDAVKAGVRRAHILDGRMPHALLLEFFTREGIGTMVGRMTLPTPHDSVRRDRGARRRARDGHVRAAARWRSSAVRAPGSGTPRAASTSTSSAGSP